MTKKEEDGGVCERRFKKRSSFGERSVFFAGSLLSKARLFSRYNSTSLSSIFNRCSRLSDGLHVDFRLRVHQNCQVRSQDPNQNHHDHDRKQHPIAYLRVQIHRLEGHFVALLNVKAEGKDPHAFRSKESVIQRAASARMEWSYVSSYFSFRCCVSKTVCEANLDSANFEPATLTFN